MTTWDDRPDFSWDATDNDAIGIELAITRTIAMALCRANNIEWVDEDWPEAADLDNDYLDMHAPTLEAELVFAALWSAGFLRPESYSIDPAGVVSLVVSKS